MRFTVLVLVRITCWSFLTTGVWGLFTAFGLNLRVTTESKGMVKGNWIVSSV